MTNLMTERELTRNFCIVAHIDHGKSTLADRILEMCGAVDEREAVDQLLDSMDLERERGITIKASAVHLKYTADDGRTYRLNLIDTPGHVDFSYEVSRSLKACEGALLLVDASQGVEAQTVANAYLAIDNDLEVIPVINKIDLKNIDPELVSRQLGEMFGFTSNEILYASARTGEGVRQVLETVVRRIPPPQGSFEAPLRALIFDSEYNPYRGVIAYVRVMEGAIRKGDSITMMATSKAYEVDEVGVLTPTMQPTEGLGAGDVGYLCAGIKNARESRVGDTITSTRNPASEPLPGYREPKPMVFAGLYPTDSADYALLKDALDKLALNDAALSYEAETSGALGFGFRCGFLGLLHMEIVQERLEREYDLDLVATAPSVVYRVYLTNGEMLAVENPAHFPEAALIDHVEEPYIRATIMCPDEAVGPCMQLSQARRGIFADMQHTAGGRVTLTYLMPLAEILLEYYDQLKSVSRGYASLDYEFDGYRPSNLVKVNILLNYEPVDALAFLTHRDFAEARARTVVERLKQLLPRQMFEIRIQAAIGRRVIAAERITALRKNVIAKCYGGDITRKRKLLEKQKAGKKRMKQIGSVDVPQEAFMSLLKI
ncbi:MAG: translation elongation factor 4 [Candidatus Zipacnadales bacterium]